MGWLNKLDQQEWNQDPLVQAFAQRWEARREEALRSLRDRARSGDLSEIRRVEARVAVIEELLKDFEDEDDQ